VSIPAIPNSARDRFCRVQLPRGYSAVEVSPSRDPGAGGVRLCVVVATGVEVAGDRKGAATGVPIVLEDGVGDRVLLGCIVDALDRVIRWLDVHIQAFDNLQGAPPAYREGLSNAVLDQRWGALAEAENAGLPGELAMSTGWERSHPKPLFVDREAKVSVHPRDEAGRPWVLCTDEALLAAAGLPPYGSSLHRYLIAEGMSGSEQVFVPVTPDAPVNDRTRPVSIITGDRLLPLNLASGLIRASARCSTSLEAFVDVLSAEPSKAVLRVDPWPSEFGASEPIEFRPFIDGGLLLSRHGERGRLVEVLHLKLRLLAEAVASVRTWVQVTQTPLLNLTASSFGVEVGGLGAALPALWTARAVLVRPGDAVPIRVPGADAEHFVAARRGVSIYQPDSAGRAVEGRAVLRLRKVTADRGPGVAVVTGTFSTQERINPKASDLTWIRVHLGSRPIDLYARLDRPDGLASGEWRLTTIPQRFGETGVAALQQAEGVPISDAPFQTLPLLSTPCDLYSLGILGIRTLLVGEDHGLPEAVDQLMSLAQVAVEESGAEGEPGMPARIRHVLGREPGWLAALGPQRLAGGIASQELALDCVPLEVWSDTLASLMRMIAGLTADSACRDLGDAPAAGMHTVFDVAAADLDRLVSRTRSLVVIDWQQNREVHSVIRRHRTGLEGGNAGNGTSVGGAAPSSARA
jgi:hypothetical protein